MIRPRGGDARGQVALYAVLLFPILMLVFALVLAVGTLEGTRARTRAQLDMAALTATQALDFAALAQGEPPRLVAAEADRLAREYLVRNLATLDLPVSATRIAAAAEVNVMAPGDRDPISGAVVSVPTVSIRATVPARVPLLSLVGLGPIVNVSVSGSAGARS
ncbi:MAG TPA: hypothetical protein VES36_04060 [Candidatus Limnocylindrales bacterium]|nr:hypothetical protein [Candidatus Limnocylindrales bacterium]